jgi:transposase
MGMQKMVYVGLDVHKSSISVATAEEGRDGTVRFMGTIPNTTADVIKLAKRLGKEGHSLAFCYEAGACGYGIYRLLVELGHECTKAGERTKTDRRDSQKPASAT